MAGLTDRLMKSTATWKHAVSAATTTLAIWTPRTSASIYLTGLDISAQGTATGTLSIFFSTSTNTRGNQVAIYNLSTTTVITPRFSGLIGGLDVPLNVHSNATGMAITAYGFEE